MSSNLRKNFKNQKDFICTPCGRTFSKLSDLKTHMFETHVDVRLNKHSNKNHGRSSEIRGLCFKELSTIISNL